MNEMDTRDSCFGLLVWDLTPNQGSIVIPILFIIYANDLNSNLLNEIAKFVDNIKLGQRAGYNINHNIIP